MIKKNNTLRVASLLLALTLITMCFVGGTFAKYTTTASGTDSARVAYWGFDSLASLDLDLFTDQYDEGGPITVDSGDDADVVAPGTAKTDTINFSYTPNAVSAFPEVDYTFAVDAVASGNYRDLDNNTSFYWTLKKDGEAADKYQTVAELIAAIKALSGDDSGTKVYESGTLPNMANEDYTIGWIWDFEAYTQCADGDPFDAGATYYTYAEGTGYTAASVDQATFEADEAVYFTADGSNDATDTAMGNKATLDNVELTITVSATQID